MKTKDNSHTKTFWLAFQLPHCGWSQRFVSFFTCFGGDFDHHPWAIWVFTLLLAITKVNSYHAMRFYDFITDSDDKGTHLKFWNELGLELVDNVLLKPEYEIEDMVSNMTVFQHFFMKLNLKTENGLMMQSRMSTIFLQDSKRQQNVMAIALVLLGIECVLCVLENTLQRLKIICFWK